LLLTSISPEKLVQKNNNDYAELIERIKAILDVLLRETSNPHNSSVDTHFENVCKEVYEYVFTCLMVCSFIKLS
jgi:hypothetical protein